MTRQKIAIIRITALEGLSKDCIKKQGLIKVIIFTQIDARTKRQIQHTLILIICDTLGVLPENWRRK